MRLTQPQLRARTPAGVVLAASGLVVVLATSLCCLGISGEWIESMSLDLVPVDCARSATCTWGIEENGALRRAPVYWSPRGDEVAIQWTAVTSSMGANACSPSTPSAAVDVSAYVVRRAGCAGKGELVEEAHIASGCPDPTGQAPAPVELDGVGSACVLVGLGASGSLVGGAPPDDFLAGEPAYEGRVVDGGERLQRRLTVQNAGLGGQRDWVYAGVDESGAWLENFNPDLTVGAVRVVQGNCNDSETRDEDPFVCSDFRCDEAGCPGIRFSRLRVGSLVCRFAATDFVGDDWAVTLPGHDGASSGCGSDDGTTPTLVTPAYALDQRAEVASWEVRFNADEGAPPPQLGRDEETGERRGRRLMLEFEVVVKP